MRRELGCAAGVFLRRRLYRRLGFVRLSDYARERLGISGRALQAAAWLATRLDALPAVSRAYDRSELSWTQARAICSVATAQDEERWLTVAHRCTVDELDRLAKRAHPVRGVVPDPEPTGNDIDGEPAIRWRIACPARVRALWRRAVEVASRVAGEPLATWQAAEVIAAEGFSGRPSGASIGDRALLEAMRLARRIRDHAEPKLDAPADVSSIDARGVTFGSSRVVEARAVVRDATIDGTPNGVVPPGRSRELDAFGLDARLQEAIGAIRTSEPRIGRLLRVVFDHRLYGMLGYAKLEDYVRERLGISLRKAWALAKVERATARSDDFARAYRDGRLSWVRALTLVPVLERANAAAWIARAETVTVRRLDDEVNWVLEMRDVRGPGASLAPPPLDSRLTSPVATAGKHCRESSLRSAPAEECRELSLATDVQIGARSTADRGESEVCDAEISFNVPPSVVALMRDTLDAFARPGTPRWTALERLLRHVLRYWESTRRHHDPIFARDGWRCTVPACSSRRNLHDHHIEFRSRGGANTRDNRTTVCAAHHLHGLHDGTIRAWGTAPAAIEWQLGVRAGAPPLAAYVGDRRRDG